MLFRQNRLLGSQRQIVCFQYLLYNFFHNILTDIFCFAVAERPAVGVTSSKRNHGRISEVSKARGVYGGGSLVRPTGKKNRAMSSMTKSASLAVIQVTVAILLQLFLCWNAYSYSMCKLVLLQRSKIYKFDLNHLIHIH